MLVRALEPLEGIGRMHSIREAQAPGLGRPDLELTSGNVRLCQALGIDRRFGGTGVRAPGAP